MIEWVGTDVTEKSAMPVVPIVDFDKESTASVDM